MPDKRVDIEIKTTADTKGAKAAVDALEDLEKQANDTSEAIADTSAYGETPELGKELEDDLKKAKEQADRLSEKIAETKEESKKASSEIGNMAAKAAFFSGLVKILDQSAKLVREIGDEQRELNGAAEGWVDVIGDIENGLRSLINPVKLGYELFAGYDTLLQEHEAKARAHAAKVTAAYVEAAEKRKRADQDAASSNAMELKLKREKDAIDAQIRSLERRNDLADAERDSKDRIADARDRTAIDSIERGGGSESQKAQQIANIKLASENRDLENKINELNDALETQRQKAAVLESQTQAMSNAYNESNEAAEKAKDKLDKFTSSMLQATDKFALAESKLEEAKKARSEGGIFSGSQARKLEEESAALNKEGSALTGDSSIKSGADLRKRIEELEKNSEKLTSQAETNAEKLDASRAEYQKAKEDLTDSEKKNALEVEALREEAKAKVSELTNDVKDTQKEELQKVADAVSGIQEDSKQAAEKITEAAEKGLSEANEAAEKAREKGLRVSANLQSAISNLTSILADGEVKPTEIARLETALRALTKSQETFGDKTIESLVSVVAINSKLLAKLNAQDQTLKAQQTQINQLLAR